ncbi:MAG: hypothetical protein ACFFCE_10550 [Promethearchaeota archaeon]
MKIIKSNFLRKYFIEIVVFSYFLIYLILIRIRTGITEYTGVNYDDFYCYVEMSKDITIIFKKEIVQPYCYRVLIPFIVEILPFDFVLEFALIGFISFYLTGIMLYFTLRIHFNKAFSLIGFFLFWSITLPKFEFLVNAFAFIYMVDLPGYLFLICSFYCILKDNKKLYGLFLCLGILTKESAIFSIPVFILYNFFNQKQNFNNYKEVFDKLFKLIIYILPGLVIFILLRTLTRPDLISNHPNWYTLYGGNEYFSLGMIKGFIEFRLEDLFKENGLFRYTIGIWEMMLFFIIFNKRKNIIRWVKIYGIFIILVYSQIFLAFATHGLIFMAFYPIIFLCVQSLENGIRKVLTYYGLNIEQDKK